MNELFVHSFLFWHMGKTVLIIQAVHSVAHVRHKENSILTQCDKRFHHHGCVLMCVVVDAGADFLTSWWSSVSVETKEAANTKAGRRVGDANSQNEEEIL